ncbi:hypothetical protein [Aeromonas salmonicida]|uniref:hypothetical protein n=1 Tax=Aeromonas salmonicida TaxID=645 RepID=UPI0037ECA6C8
MSNTLAPIILFVYNRLWHTQQTLNALMQNELAAESDLIVYSDGGKDTASWEQVNAVREYIGMISGFKSITLINRDYNFGLADNIISGVTETLSHHGHVIVLEDDIITSRYFLRYMNEALSFYESHDDVMHIGGYVPNIHFEEESHFFLNRTMYCWGWATWRSAWKHFTHDVSQIDAAITSNEIIHEMNLQGCNPGVYEQFLANKAGKIRTWAIFWYLSIFLKNGLCLVPKRSFTHNIGNDSSGVHCGTTTFFDTAVSEYYFNDFNSHIVEDEMCLGLLKKFYRG